jgi:transposase
MQVNWSDNFEDLYKQRGQQKHGVRLLALWKIQSGLSEEAVCAFIGKTHKTIRTWRRLYEAGGLDALLSIRSGRGKKARLPNLAALREDIQSLQSKQSGGRVKCQNIVDMVWQKYEIQYTTSGMYHILKRLGFSWITSRSQHPKRNLQAQEDFKKNSLKK